jgi:arabinoxylan arabinofuranohydrolase
MKKLISIVTALCAAELAPSAQAADPIIQTKFTADPAPYVVNGVVYLYAGHDENNAQGFLMRDWLLYTSTDMVNWTDHGTVADLKNFKWADKAISGWGGFDNGAWAPQVIGRNGKFYMYCPLQGRGIGVLVADKPEGPFTDAIGKPLVSSKFDSIDPTVFIDDDGQAYLYWGNPNLWYVKLNKDMISFEGEPVKDPSIAKVKGQPDPFHYQEGPWAYKHDGHYYLAYASTCCPEGLGYAMSTSPTGPWEFKGYIMKPDRRSSGNHPGIIDYKGKSYVFGFNYKLNFNLTNKHRERRSVCVVEMSYNPDGTIKECPWWEEAPSVTQLEALNPYKRVEAETIAWSEGITTTPGSTGGMSILPTGDGAYIKVQGVDFGAKGAGTFTASIAGETKPGATQEAVIELRLDAKDGPLIGTLPLSYTAGQWKTVTAAINGATGRHDLFLIFKGDIADPLFKVDYWQFAQKTDAKQAAAIQATIEHYKIDSTEGTDHTSPVKVVAILADGSTKDVTASAKITSENPAVASVVKNVITGAAPGETKIQVKAGGKTESLPIIVKDIKAEVVAKKLSLSISEATLLVGNSQNFTATAEFIDGHTEDVTTASSYVAENPKIASIKDGVILALDKGTMTVQASFKGKRGDPVTAPIKVSAAYRNPYEQNRAEEFTTRYRVSTQNCSEGGKNVSNIENGSWVCFKKLEFEAGTKAVEFRVSSASNGGTIEVHLDRLDGPLAGSCAIAGSHGWQTWTTQACNIQGIEEGIHDIYLKFTGDTGFLLNLNKWQFTK